MTTAHEAGTFTIGGELEVNRLGYGRHADHRPRRLGPATRPRRRHLEENVAAAAIRLDGQDLAELSA